MFLCLFHFYADGTSALDCSIRWLYKDDELTPFARCEKGRLHYIVVDHLGTPRELFDERSNLKWAARNDVWGKTEAFPYIAANDDIHPDCNLRFLGQYYDEDKFVGNISLSGTN